MLGIFLKNLSILKKFLFVNFVVFLIIIILSLIYLNNVKPSLIKDKSSKHVKTINNTIEYLDILNINFNKDEIRDFLLRRENPLRYLDRVQFFDKKFNLIGDTDTLDLDPRAFTQRLGVVEMNDLNEKKKSKKRSKQNFK